MQSRGIRIDRKDVQTPAVLAEKPLHRTEVGESGPAHDEAADDFQSMTIRESDADESDVPFALEPGDNRRLEDRVGSAGEVSNGPA